MRALRLLLFFAAALGANLALAGAAGLPARLEPPAPFPQILAEAPAVTFVAPGVYEGDYAIDTVDGPIAVHIVEADVTRSDVRVQSLLSHDMLTSKGETIDSMARRAGAVAGINGDYFDIDSTDQPLNVLVRDGVLLRTPGARYAITIGSAGIRYASLSFAGSVTIGTQPPLALAAVNQVPPPGGGVALITPEFGSVAPVPNLTLVALQPLDGTPPFSRYRAASIADNSKPSPPGYYLAIGLNAYGDAGVPNPGDVIVASGDLSPIPLAQIAAAVGGGPMILHDGVWFDDPHGTAGAPTQTLIPASAVASSPDGRLFLIEVDGRQSTLSIGVTRTQLVAIMKTLGATEGMALDGGGSSTLVSREPGDADATLRNSPSDGSARPVADGIFIFSDALQGPPARIFVTPGTVRVVAGAHVPLRVAVTDAGGHPRPVSGLRITVTPAGLGTVANGTFRAARDGIGTLHVSADGLVATTAIAIVNHPDRLHVIARDRNLMPGDRTQLYVVGTDAKGYPIAVDGSVTWSTNTGRIARDGSFVAGARDADIVARVGKNSATTRITVGVHEVPATQPATISFSSTPKGGPGGAVSAATPDCPSCFTLAYDFSGGERAAFASLSLALPANALGIAVDVDGDGRGAALRLTGLNTINERVYVPVTILNFTGWRHIVVKFPAELALPKRLESFYILGTASHGAGAEGSIVLRNVHVLLPGSPAPR